MRPKLDDYQRRCRPGRTIQGISAVLLPYQANGQIDESGFRTHLRRTLKAGLRAAVNMDTGYVDLLTAEEKQRVLKWTRDTVDGGDWFAAGALPVFGDTSLSLAKAYVRECSLIRDSGGIPVIFPSPGYAKLDGEALIELFREIAANVGTFIAFELGNMFSPHGRMFSERVLAALMELPACRGLKHSSLDRSTELARLELRDRLRPDFIIYSGNDLAADMIEFGSDYLLGLSTFAPELFAARDLAWKRNEATYFELRDLIQYLGWIGFREPVPAYKHSAAIFLKLTGGLETDEPHPRAARREARDCALLADAAKRLERIMQTESRPTKRKNVMARICSNRFWGLIALAVIFGWTTVAVSQTRQTKKVFMITDMEGVDGIFNSELQCIPFQSPRFEESKKLLTGEINAAVDGLFEGGATEVVVWDGHDASRTLSTLDIHPKARLLMGSPVSSTLELDSSYSAVIFIGQHAMAGAEKGVLAHSYSSDGVQNIWVNNKLVGEIGARVMLAGTFGIPAVMLSGDAAACEEIHQLVPQAECAEVKWGVSRTAAFSLSHPAACSLIHEKARHAMERLAEFKPYTVSGPVEVKVQFTTKATPDLEPRAGIERLDERTWVFRGKDIIDAWLKYSSF